MNYKEALNYIHSTKKFGSRLGLANIKKLLELLGNPQNDIKIIHVGGTNGKGSTSAFMYNIIKAEGYKVGLFTSPYLEIFNERIRINGDMIPNERLAEVTCTVKEKVEELVSMGCSHPTEFEIVTAIALLFYKQENVDFLILEVGLGGRYDATNAVESTVASVVTPISMDHMNVLGDTIEKIAYEKAGIIKKNSLVISHPQKKGASQVIQNVTDEKDGELIFSQNDKLVIKSCNENGSEFDFSYEDYSIQNLHINVLGKHQIYNACTALTVLNALRKRKIIDLRLESIREGLKKTRWKGRLEVISKQPTIVIDGAHNLQGAQALKESIMKLFNYDRLILGIGMLDDKDIDNVLQELIPLTHSVVVTQAMSPRAMNAEELGKKIEKYKKDIYIESDIEKAVHKSLDIAQKGDLIVFSGSLYLIGEVRSNIKKLNK